MVWKETIHLTFKVKLNWTRTILPGGKKKSISFFFPLRKLRRKRVRYMVDRSLQADTGAVCMVWADTSCNTTVEMVRACYLQCIVTAYVCGLGYERNCITV